MRTRIKICGITCIEDALCAARMGVDALGFIFVKESPRCISLKRAYEIIRFLPLFVSKIGVFKDQDIEWIREVFDKCRLNAVQLHGDESPDYCKRLKVEFIKAFRVKDNSSLHHVSLYCNNEKSRPFLLDTYVPDRAGGTGQTFNWDLVKTVSEFGPVILSGGLNPENVSKAICKVKPFAVDTSSGLEISPGKKDPEKMKKFIKEVYRTDSDLYKE